jgi:hypothetical protein
LDSNPLSKEAQLFEEFLRAPEKRQECLQLLNAQQVEHLKTIKKARSQCVILASLATIVWVGPKLTGFSPEGLLIEQVFRVVPLLCLLGGGSLVFRVITTWLFKLDIDSQVRCLQLAEYIDEKSG